MALSISYITDQYLPQTATDTEQLVSMCAALGQAGADVSIYGPRNWFKPTQSVRELADYYKTAESFDYKPVNGLMPTFRGLEKISHPLFSVINKSLRQSDLIYTRNIPAVLWFLFFTRIPVVYETYRPWPDQKPRTISFFKWLGNHPRMAGLVLHSKLAADSYELAGVPSRKMLVAHNGYNPLIMEPVLEKSEAKQLTGLDPARPVVTYTGRVNMKKGLKVILTLAESYPAIDFVVVGSEGNGEFERKARFYNNILVFDWKPFEEVTPFLYASDILLIPPTTAPLTETGNTVLPMKTFLYMAANRPILGPDNVDLKEVLKDGETARLIEPDKPDLLITALGDLINDKQLQTRLASNALASVRNNTWEDRGRNVLGFLHRRISKP